MDAVGGGVVVSVGPGHCVEELGQKTEEERKRNEELDKRKWMFVS